MSDSSMKATVVGSIIAGLSTVAATMVPMYFVNQPDPENGSPERRGWRERSVERRYEEDERERESEGYRSRRQSSPQEETPMATPAAVVQTSGTATPAPEAPMAVEEPEPLVDTQVERAISVQPVPARSPVGRTATGRNPFARPKTAGESPAQGEQPASDSEGKRPKFGPFNRGRQTPANSNDRDASPGAQQFNGELSD